MIGKKEDSQQWVERGCMCTGKVPGNKMFVQKHMFVVILLTINVIITWVKKNDRIEGEVDQ